MKLLGAISRLFRRKGIVVTRTCPYCGSTVKLRAEAVSAEEVNQAYKEGNR